MCVVLARCLPARRWAKNAQQFIDNKGAHFTTYNSFFLFSCWVADREAESAGVGMRGVKPSIAGPSSGLVMS
jgi:hypothetical protein